jgi:hypothetical protein
MAKKAAKVLAESWAACQTLELARNSAIMEMGLDASAASGFETTISEGTWGLEERRRTMVIDCIRSNSRLRKRHFQKLDTYVRSYGKATPARNSLPRGGLGTSCSSLDRAGSSKSAMVGARVR